VAGGFVRLRRDVSTDGEPPPCSFWLRISFPLFRKSEKLFFVVGLRHAGTIESHGPAGRHEKQAQTK